MLWARIQKGCVGFDINRIRKNQRVRCKNRMQIGFLEVSQKLILQSAS